MKKISILLIAILFVFLITGCGATTNGVEEDQEVFATISAKVFYDADADFYKQYINKKITITDLTADGPDYIDYKMGFNVLCDNKNELPSDLKGNVTVTGIVSDGELQNGYYLQLKKCTVKQ